MIRSIYKTFHKARPQHRLKGPFTVTMLEVATWNTVAVWTTDTIFEAIDVFQEHCLPPEPGHLCAVVDAEQAILMGCRIKCETEDEAEDKQFFGLEQCFDILELCYPVREDVMFWRVIASGGARELGWHP